MGKNLCTFGEFDVISLDAHLHRYRFDLRTGAATREPCVEPVPSYPVRLDGDDVLVDERAVTAR